MIEYIDQLVEAGVTSLKIEGRAKSSYYVSMVTNAYRCAVDHYLANPTDFVLPDWIRDEVFKVSHRRYSTGFYFGRPDQYYENGGYLREYDVVALVDSYENGYLHCTQKNKFYVGDEVEIIAPSKEPLKMKITKILDEEGNLLENACHPQMKLKLPSDTAFESGAFIRKAREDITKRA